MRKSLVSVELRSAAYRQAWAGLCPDDIFANITLGAFTKIAERSLNARARLAALDEQRQALIAERDAADAETWTAMKRIALAVQADAKHGPNSPLFAAMGHTPRAARAARRSQKASDDSSEASA